MKDHSIETDQIQEDQKQYTENEKLILYGDPQKT